MVQFSSPLATRISTCSLGWALAALTHKRVSVMVKRGRVAAQIEAAAESAAADEKASSIGPSASQVVGESARGRNNTRGAVSKRQRGRGRSSGAVCDDISERGAAARVKELEALESRAPCKTLSHCLCCSANSKDSVSPRKHFSRNHYNIITNPFRVQ